MPRTLRTAPGAVDLPPEVRRRLERFTVVAHAQSLAVRIDEIVAAIQA